METGKNAEALTPMTFIVGKKRVLGGAKDYKKKQKNQQSRLRLHSPLTLYSFHFPWLFHPPTLAILLAFQKYELPLCRVLLSLDQTLEHTIPLPHQSLQLSPHSLHLQKCHLLVWG